MKNQKSTTTSSVIERKTILQLAGYLHELGDLLGRSVVRAELESSARTLQIRDDSRRLVEAPCTAHTADFHAMRLERFSNYIERLSAKNNSSVFIWTPRSVTCGTLLVSNLAEVRFDFDFGINSEGILVFLTSDLEDRMTLDFFLNEKGEKKISIETQGKNWPHIEY